MDSRSMTSKAVSVAVAVLPGIQSRPPGQPGQPVRHLSVVRAVVADASAVGDFDFANKVREYCYSVDLTLKELAASLELPDSTLGYWLAGSYRQRRARGEATLNRAHVKLVIASLVKQEAVLTLEEAVELLALAFPTRPRLHKFNQQDKVTSWYRTLLANSTDTKCGLPLYTAHRDRPTQPSRSHSRAVAADNGDVATTSRSLSPQEPA